MKYHHNEKIYLIIYIYIQDKIGKMEEFILTHCII